MAAHVKPKDTTAIWLCRICGGAAATTGSKESDFSGRLFELGRCGECGFAFVVDPREDFGVLYDASYYRGGGASPEVDYERALGDPNAVQVYEWHAVLRIVGELVPLTASTRWLDYGCGLGGLVRYVRNAGHDAIGYDEGYAAERLSAEGTPSLARKDFPAHAGTFEVVTAIEVLEHALDPLAVLEEISGLLKPGGVLFLTTGNAERFKDRLAEWRYVQPDVHISFFEPRTLEIALRRVDLEPEFVGYLPGFTELIRCKVLRTLGVKRRNWFERAVPWGVVSRVADWRYGVSVQPIGRKP